MDQMAAGLSDLSVPDMGLDTLSIIKPHLESVVPDRKPDTSKTADPIAQFALNHHVSQIYIGLRIKTAEDQVGSGPDRQWIINSEADLPGGRQTITHSESRRPLQLIAEDGATLTITVATNTRIAQVRKMVAQMWSVDELELSFIGKFGNTWKRQLDLEEAAGSLRVKGLQRFERARKEYKFPIMVIGAGFGGIVTSLKLLQRGRTDFVMFEKLPDYGGFSWYGIANKTTKLQTEAGTYHIPYFFPDHDPVWDMPTWPSRDYLLMMFQRHARQYGLEEYTKFNTKVLKVTPKGKGTGPDRRYQTLFEPADGTGEAEMSMFGACMTWPGNLCTHKLDDYPGEEEFGGYIEYASLNRADFSKCTGKLTVIVGHGAFAIENVRTCLEYDCAKMTVVCRRRNICSPKIVSWMVTQSQFPIPGPVMLDAMHDAYKLADWDPWTAYSVKTDAKRTFARVDQGTMFGCTDVFFVAAYYGLMDVVVGVVKRLTHHCMHMKNYSKVHCEVILKTVGVRGSYEVDKMLGLKELVGYWVNGDPLVSCVTNSLFVQAGNFAGFSIAPGLSGSGDIILYFVDHPDDFELVRNLLPKHNKENSSIHGNAMYVYSAAHATNTALMCAQLPGIQLCDSINGALKWRKQQMKHPLPDFFKECTAEWEMYCDMCEQHPCARKDRPRPAYPYTMESIGVHLQTALDIASKRF